MKEEGCNDCQQNSWCWDCDACHYHCDCNDDRVKWENDHSWDDEWDDSNGDDGGDFGIGN